MMRQAWTMVLALSVVGWAAAPVEAQLYYPSGVGSPTNYYFTGPPGRIRFGNSGAAGHNLRPSYYYGSHAGFGFKPAYPYASGYWGSNPYLSYYYGYSTPAIYYPPAYYYPPDYGTPPAGAYSPPPPPARDDARLPPPTQLPAPDANVAYIDLHVPAGASVWAQGVKMETKGTLRRFITPALEPGTNYSYEFRIVYPENGKDVSLVRHISVAAGDRKSLTILEGTAGK